MTVPRILLKGGSAAALAAANPFVAQREMVVEHDTGRSKIGPMGGAYWNDLPYADAASISAAGSAAAGLVADAVEPLLPTAGLDASTAGLIDTEGSETNARLKAAFVPTDLAVVPLTSITVWGDSLTASAGTDWPTTVLAPMTGLAVENMGASGQGATDILMRMGAVQPRVTLAGGQVPAGATPVAVTAIDPDVGWRYSGIGAFAFNGTLAGAVAGALTHDLATDTWTFTRTTAGDPVTVPDGSLFVRDPQYTRPTGSLIYWAGRNNVGSLPLVSDLADLVPPSQRTTVKRYLIIGVTNGTNEPSGTTNYTAVVAFNARMAARHGDRFYDIRRDFIDNGLAIAGLTPTTADIAAIAADTPPPSLMSDVIHPNGIGYGVVGRLVAEKLLAMGWVDSLAYPVEPVEPATVLTSDSFNRADTAAGSLGSTDAAAGGSPLAWTVDSQLQILSNQVGATSLSTTRFATVDLGVADHYVETVLTGSIAEGGLAARWTDASNYYTVRVYSGGTLSLEKRAAGVTTTLETAAAGSVVPGDTVGLEVAGERLRVYLNGAKVLERASDTSLTTGTRAGLRSSFSNTGFGLDDFKAQDHV